MMMRTIQGECKGVVLTPLISVTHPATPKHACLGVHVSMDKHAFLFSYVNMTYTCM